jgi:hypothetical protein
MSKGRHDMTMYFDAVLDDRMNPLYNGTTEEVLAWLETEKPMTVSVCIGKTMQIVTVEKYVEQFG